MMEYKGYIGKVDYDDEAGIFHGEVVNLRDVITFAGESVPELRQAFQESVDAHGQHEFEQPRERSAGAEPPPGSAALSEKSAGKLKPPPGGTPTSRRSPHLQEVPPPPGGVSKWV